MKCEFCGMPVPEHCDGVQTLGPDPYQEDINDDDSDYLLCEGQRYESAMEI